MEKDTREFNQTEQPTSSASWNQPNGILELLFLFFFLSLFPPPFAAFSPPIFPEREKEYSGSYHSQSFNRYRVLYVSYYCTLPPLDFDGLNDIHDSFSNTSSPQSTNPSFLLSILAKLAIRLILLSSSFQDSVVKKVSTVLN
jgi:hypothetical protein